MTAPVNPVELHYDNPAGFNMGTVGFLTYLYYTAIIMIWAVAIKGYS